jgi:hypothetical protein
MRNASYGSRRFRSHLEPARNDDDHKIMDDTVYVNFHRQTAKASDGKTLGPPLGTTRRLEATRQRMIVLSQSGLNP